MTPHIRGTVVIEQWADLAHPEGVVLTPEDQARLRWHGVLAPASTANRFDIRIHIPQGQITAEQLEALGWLSQVYASAPVSITTEHTIVLRAVLLAEIAHVLAELASVGLTTQTSARELVRNIVGCPLADVDAEPLLDSSSLLATLRTQMLRHPAFGVLPRHFVISVTGCAHRCTLHQRSDIGLTATRNAVGDAGYEVWLGGGHWQPFSDRQRLGIFVRETDVIEIVAQLVELYRLHRNPVGQRRARLQTLLMAWGQERFQAVLAARLGRSLELASAEDNARHTQPDHQGIGQQRTAKQIEPLYYLSARLVRSQLAGKELVRIAGLARLYGQGQVRFTAAQQLVVLGVPNANLPALQTELATLGLLTNAPAPLLWPKFAAGQALARQRSYQPSARFAAFAAATASDSTSVEAANV